MPKFEDLKSQKAETYKPEKKVIIIKVCVSLFLCRVFFWRPFTVNHCSIRLFSLFATSFLAHYLGLYVIRPKGFCLLEFGLLWFDLLTFGHLLPILLHHISSINRQISSTRSCSLLKGRAPYFSEFWLSAIHLCFTLEANWKRCWKLFPVLTAM